MKKSIIYFLLFCLIQSSVAQQNKIDSLITILKAGKADTSFVDALNLIAREYWGPDPKLARTYSDSALHVGMKIKYQKGTANAFSNIGNINHFMGNYDSALYYHLKALKLYESINYKKGIANAYNNIANVYYRTDKYDIALDYHQKSLVIRKELNDLKGIALSLNNIGNIHLQQKREKIALEYYVESLNYRQQLGDLNDIFQSLNNLGILYTQLEDHEKALDYHFQSLKIKETLNDQTGIAISNGNIGGAYKAMKQYKLSIQYLEKGLEIAKRIGLKDFIKESYLSLSGAYKEMMDYKNAYDYYVLYSSIKDSIYSTENSKQIAEMQTLYESEKKDKEILLLQKDSEMKEATASANNKKQKIIIYSVSGILFLVLCFALFAWKSYRQKQKANIEISLQKEIIEEKSKEITDSIHYAKRIQQALLASDNFLKKYLNDYFILYKPKDIVSGDFYWANVIDNKFILITADCTGHGVPGAFMSLLNISYLNEAIAEKKIDAPEKILDYVRTQIIQSLNPEGSEVESKDGMDAVLCVFDLKGGWLRFAGANNPLWLIRNNELKEFIPDKMPVGMHHGDLKPFTSQTLGLRKGDIIYLFTDGFADQFGGPKAKKFKYKQLKEKLLSMKDLQMQEQKKVLEQTFEEWKGGFEQVDDVCIIGIKL